MAKPTKRDESIRNSKIKENEIISKGDKDKATRILEEHFYRKNTSPVTDYKKSRDKTDGQSEGYIAENMLYKTTSMIKMAPKNPDKKNVQLFIEKGDIAREYIISDIFKRLLYDYAPQISLVDMGDDNFAIKSEYLKNFITLEDGEKNGTINQGNIPKIENFERVIAASIFAGDADFHKNNIGVIERNGILYAAKIDHGRATVSFYNDKEELIESLYYKLSKFEYLSDGYNFNIDKFKDAINEITKITDDEIEKLVGSKFEQMKKIGIKLEVVTNINGPVYELDLNEHKQKMINGLKQSKQIMIDLKDRLDIFGKVDKNEKLINENWLTQMRDTDPIRWAAENHYTIEGRKPIDWVLEENKKRAINNQKPLTIEGMDPEQWKTSVMRKIDLNGGYEDNIFSAIKKGYKTEYINNFIKDNKIDINKPEEKEGVVPLHVAAFGGEKEIVQLLLDMNANLNIKDKNFGFTPLFAAVLVNNNKELIQLLINNNADVNIQAKDGLAPLDYAVRQHNDPELATMLIKAGANPNNTDGIWKLSGNNEDLFKALVMSDVTEIDLNNSDAKKAFDKNLTKLNNKELNKLSEKIKANNSDGTQEYLAKIMQEKLARTSDSKSSLQEKASSKNMSLPTSPSSNVSKSNRSGRS